MSGIERFVYRRAFILRRVVKTKGLNVLRTYSGRYRRRKQRSGVSDASGIERFVNRKGGNGSSGSNKAQMRRIRRCAERGSICRRAVKTSGLNVLRTESWRY